MTLSDREIFMAAYSSAIASLVTVGIDISVAPPEVQFRFNKMLETIRKSLCKNLTLDDATKMADEIGFVMNKINTIIEEALSQNRLGDKI